MKNDELFEQLNVFYEEDPTDPFNVYSLALAYVERDLNQALRLFDELLHKHKEYLPTYYHAAQVLVALEQNEKALGVLEAGIALANRQQNTKTLRELRASKQALEDDLSALD